MSPVRLSFQLSLAYPDVSLEALQAIGAQLHKHVAFALPTLAQGCPSALELCPDMPVAPAEDGGLACTLSVLCEAWGDAENAALLHDLEKLVVDEFTTQAVTAGVELPMTLTVRMERAHVRPFTEAAPTLEGLLELPPDEHYWVACGEGAPERLLFSRTEAFRSRTPFIDAFDAGGFRLRRYRRVGGSNGPGYAVQPPNPGRTTGP